MRNDPNNPKNQAWLNKVQAYEYVGASGTMSCSPSGAGGFTGCGLKEIDAAYAEKKQDPGVAFGLLIAEERKRRLSGIDAAAAETEALEVQSEKARAEREAKLAADQANGVVPPAPTDEADVEPLPDPQ